jgi:curli biogenesis system outer membrane secretion channel CsgG
MTRITLLGCAALALLSTEAAAQSSAPSSGYNEQMRGEAQMPVCNRPIGTVAIVPPDNQWWHEYNLGSPEAVLKLFVQRSGCFTLVNRGSAMKSREMERALAEQGELQQGANMTGGQVKAADYFLQPDIVSANQNSGGGGIGGALGGIVGHHNGWGTIAGVAGGINVKKGEANVTLSLVNAHTTEESTIEGYFRKRDVSFSLGGGGWWGAAAAGLAGTGYENTEVGQIIVLAYLDAYKKLVAQLGGWAPPPPAAPQR